MRRVFDCTIINDELDMLELRFRTLEDVVDTFVVDDRAIEDAAHQIAPSAMNGPTA